MSDFNFFEFAPPPSYAISGPYIISLVILSYMMAFLASYVALEIADSLRHKKAKLDIWLLFSGAFAMGASIFTMHFIGMLAFVMPIKMEYELGETLFSLAVAIVASGFALLLIRSQEVGKIRLIFGGAILGLAIAGMHYTGMASMLHVTIHYLPTLFFLSIAIAIGAAIAALWAMLQYEKRKKTPYAWLFKTMSALVLAAGICGMHYVGMSAAVFPPFKGLEKEAVIYLLSSEKLAILIAYIASSIMIVTLLFNSYRHLILVKLLIGYITVILLTAPLGFISASVFNDMNQFLGNIHNINDLFHLHEGIEIFGKESFFIYLLIIGSIIFLSLLLSIFLSYQFSAPIAQLKNSAIKVAKGDLTQRVPISSDDEMGQLGLSFNRMVEALAESKQEENEVMSIVAHDLKHPLSIIKQASSLLENELLTNQTDKLEKLNQMIYRESTSLLSLIDDLLAAHSFQSFALKLDLKKIPIGAFANAIFEFNQLLAEKKGIQFKLRIQTEEEYSFDEDKIKQVINNLSFEFFCPFG